MTVIVDFTNYDKVEIEIPAGGQETIKMQRLAPQSKTDKLKTEKSRH
jgi:hypothetical protein